MNLRLAYKHKVLIFALILSATILGILGFLQKETRIVGTIKSKHISFSTSGDLENLFSLDHVQPINQVIIRNYDKIDLLGETGLMDQKGRISILSNDSADYLLLNNVNLSNFDLPKGVVISLNSTEENANSSIHNSETILEMSLGELSIPIEITPSETSLHIDVSHAGEIKHVNNEIKNIFFTTSETIKIFPDSKHLTLNLVFPSSTTLREDDPVMVESMSFALNDDNQSKSKIVSGNISIPYYNKKYLISRNYPVSFDKKDTLVINSLTLRNGLFEINFEGRFKNVTIGPLKVQIIPSILEYIFTNYHIVTLVNTLLALAALFMAVFKETNLQSNEQE
jgi:hypothetical protein